MMKIILMIIPIKKNMVIMMIKMIKIIKMTKFIKMIKMIMIILIILIIQDYLILISARGMTGRHEVAQGGQS